MRISKWNSKTLIRCQILTTIAGIVWLATLLGLHIYWRQSLNSKSYLRRDVQYLPYISDLGADVLRPFFVVGATGTTALFGEAIVRQRRARWDRFLDRCLDDDDRQIWGYPICVSRIYIWQWLFNFCLLTAACLGCCGVICLAVFDWKLWPSVHYAALGAFVAGFITHALLTSGELCQYAALPIPHCLPRGSSQGSFARAPYSSYLT